MNVVGDPYRSVDLPRGGIITIGNFDGVHVGHRAMVQQVVARARELDAPAVVITFDPHPLEVLAPEKAPKRIQTARQREEALAELGIDAILVIPFTRDFAALTAEEFVAGLLGKRLAVREVHVGSTFVFGCEKKGDLALLSRVGAEFGIAVRGIPYLADEEGPISSTRVRNAVEAGDAVRARALLGRPYVMDGMIAKGDRMGRKIGFPTINLLSENELCPADGVYVGRVLLRSFDRTFVCVTNIGRRPTVYEDYATTIESYILDFSSDVYGERIQLSFYDRLRDEMVFPSMLELTSQIRKDVDATRRYFLAQRES